MKNYKEQCPPTCCGNCTFMLTEDHYGHYCTHGVNDPVTIKWDTNGDEFSNSGHAFHEWADERIVEWNGICDVWESGGINKGH